MVAASKLLSGKGRSNASPWTQLTSGTGCHLQSHAWQIRSAGHRPALAQGWSLRHPAHRSRASNVVAMNALTQEIPDLFPFSPCRVCQHLRRKVQTHHLDVHRILRSCHAQTSDAKAGPQASVSCAEVISAKVAVFPCGCLVAKDVRASKGLGYETSVFKTG